MVTVSLYVRFEVEAQPDLLYLVAEPWQRHVFFIHVFIGNCPGDFLMR